MYLVFREGRLLPVPGYLPVLNPVQIIPGHDNIFVTIGKEISSAQVKTYEGHITYQGNSANSAFNFVVSGGLFIGHGRMPAENETYSMFGTLIHSAIKDKINNADVIVFPGIFYTV